MRILVVEDEVNLANVLEEQERLGRKVDDLPLLARIDEGQTLERTEVDLDDTVFQESPRPLGVAVDTSGVQPMRIEGDRRRLTQMVRNLVDNAARHTESRVVVTLEREGDQGILAVASAHGGAAVAAASSDGGARFEVTFPFASPADRKADA